VRNPSICVRRLCVVMFCVLELCLAVRLCCSTLCFSTARPHQHDMLHSLAWLGELLLCRILAATILSL
jgi:hypothetical protein